MSYRFARRSKDIKDSIFTDILQYLEDPEFISFSGGFPSVTSFPISAIEKAAVKVLQNDGAAALQYSSTEGHLPLRKWIAQRYLKRSNLEVDPNDILITTGSQQAIDLISKSFLDPNDHIVVEYPSYLGALQSFSMFEPVIHEVMLQEDGLDVEALQEILEKHDPKLLYVIPNFHNPTGISYSQEKRMALVELIKKHNILLIEDDPYGELRYVGEDKALLKALLPDQVILMGSFSKIISPGIRLGWVVAPKGMMKQLFNAKEASDLHASTLDQRIVTQYLMDNNLDDQLSLTRQNYAQKRAVMKMAMERFFPKEVIVSPSEGGMFFWITLPKHVLAQSALEAAIKEKVIFIPGNPFYVNPFNVHTLRLNYTSPTEEQILIGIERLADVFKALI